MFLSEDRLSNPQTLCYTEILGYLLGTRSESRRWSPDEQKAGFGHCFCFGWLLSHSFVTPWTAARQAPLSHGIYQARVLKWAATSFSRDLSDPGMEPRLLCLLHWQADSLPLSHLRSSALATGHPEFKWCLATPRCSDWPLLHPYMPALLGAFLQAHLDSRRKEGCVDSGGKP